MRSFFQSRNREPASRPVSPSRPHAQAPSAMLHPEVRDDLDDGVAVSELSDLEARALCAREGIPFFWRESAAGAQA